MILPWLQRLYQSEVRRALEKARGGCYPCLKGPYKPVLLVYLSDASFTVLNLALKWKRIWVSAAVTEPCFTRNCEGLSYCCYWSTARIIMKVMPLAYFVAFGLSLLIFRTIQEVTMLSIILAMYWYVKLSVRLRETRAGARTQILSKT